MNKRALLLAAALILSGCSNSVESETESGGFISSGATDDDSVNEDREPFDEDAAREAAQQEVTDEGYSGPCTIDCSGHNAGFAWAADGNEDEGVSNSPSFDEGQEAYEEAVDDKVEEYRQAYEDGEDQPY